MYAGNSINLELKRRRNQLYGHLSHYCGCASIRDPLRGGRLLMLCELNVCIMASKLSMYFSHSKNLEQRRWGKPTVRSSLPLWVCVNERLFSCYWGKRALCGLWIETVINSAWIWAGAFRAFVVEVEPECSEDISFNCVLPGKVLDRHHNRKWS